MAVRFLLARIEYKLTGRRPIRTRSFMPMTRLLLAAVLTLAAASNLTAEPVPL
jgi:hypothetical protein